jgi:hypothetical protein
MTKKIEKKFAGKKNCFTFVPYLCSFIYWNFYSVSENYKLQDTTNKGETPCTETWAFNL